MKWSEHCKDWAIRKDSFYQPLFISADIIAVLDVRFDFLKTINDILPNGVNLKSGWRLFSSADNLTTVRGNEIIPEARIKNNF